jgi:hypothetical protein
MTPYQFVYGKDCHLPVELEHKAYWVIKEMNLDLSDGEIWTAHRGVNPSGLVVRRGGI